jgi:uncharacterized membrane protein YbhN (UPF0104 family)
MSIRKILSLVILPAMVAGIVLYALRHKSEFHLISHVSAGEIAILSVLTVITLLCYAAQLKIVTDHYHLNLTFLLCFGISRATTFVDLWLPFGGGSSLKAIYLNKFHDLRYSSFIASMSVAQIVKLIINGFIAILLLGVAGFRTHSYLTAVAAAVFASSLTFFLMAHRVNRKKFRIPQYVEALMEEWQKIRTDQKTMYKLVLLNIVIFLVKVSVVQAAFRAFGIDMPFIASGLVSNFSTVSGIFNLVPGNLGVQEAVVVLVSAACGKAVNEGLHAAALMRIVRTTWNLALAPVFSRNLLQKADNV